MKANHLITLCGLSCLIMVSACATRHPKPLASVPPPPSPASSPIQLPPPASDWRVIAARTGRWRIEQQDISQESKTPDKTWFSDDGQTAQMTLSCETPHQTMVFSWPWSIDHGEASSNLTALITTTTIRRTLPLMIRNKVLLISLSTNDPLLDAIAFSRGRFMITANGAAPLVFPVTPEIARVIEDCR